MLSLLAGLLIRPRATMQQIVQKPSIEQASRLGYFMLVLLMINTVFSVGIDPEFDQYLGSGGKWVFALLYPPLQYGIHRFLFVVSARFGLTMFAPKQVLQQDLQVQAEKLQLVKMVFPYTIFPLLFLGIIGLPFATGIGFLLMLLGFVYMLILPMFALKEIYGVSGTVAFWAPVFIQFLIFLFLGLVVTVISIVWGLLGTYL